MRVIYCPNCQVYYHRDVLSEDNIANVGIYIMKHGTRPDYLPIWTGRKPSDTSSDANANATTSTSTST